MVGNPLVFNYSWSFLWSPRLLVSNTSSSSFTGPEVLHIQLSGSLGEKKDGGVP
nr:hypothetical protein Iba_chr15cCG9150 [Ipomoea batatas]